MTFDKTSNEPYVLFRSDLNFAHISAGRIPVRIFKDCSEQITLVFVSYSITLYVLGGFHPIRSQLMLLQFIKKNLLEPAENYRPISILAIVSKVMERYVCNRLYCHVSQSITSLQHGFTRSRWGGT